MSHCRRDFWYYAIVCVLAVLTIVPRFVVLEERPLHHDEAQHAWYGYSYMRDGHYSHSPILHGPSLILITGLTYRVFGDSIGIGRGMVAAFSLIAMIAAAALWPRRYRWWLLPLIVTSPYLLYYSRFLRNELIFCALVLIGLIGFDRSLQGRSLMKRAMWGILGPAPIIMLLAFKENAVFVMASGLTFVGAWVLSRLLWRRKSFSSANFFSPELVATWSGWVAGVIIGMAYVLLIYGITTPDHTFSPWMNINRSIDYWAGQQREHRISGALYYHLPIILIYELPIVLMLAVGLIRDALRRPTRTFIYLCSFIAWLVIWIIWHYATPLPGPLGAIEQFLHVEPGSAMLVLGFCIVPLLVWSVLALKEHMVLGSWMTWWAACSLFQYSVAGEKVPWLGVHMVLPLYMMLGWVWAPIMRRSGFAMRVVAAVAIIASTLLAVKNDYPLVGPRSADPIERMVYNHTTVEYDRMCREWVSRWNRLNQEKPITTRRVDLVGDLGWPGVWYFRHCSYELPENPPENTNGWELLMGTRSTMQPLVEKLDSARWSYWDFSLRDHWSPTWPEGDWKDKCIAWWRYYWLREPWLPKAVLEMNPKANRDELARGHFESTVIEPIPQPSGKISYKH